MKKLKLVKVNPGSYQNDQVVCERLKTFNNGKVDLTDNKIIIKTSDNNKFASNLRKTEEDFMSETFLGSFEDGSSFRLIKPGGVAKQILSAQGQVDSIIFGGMTGDGYAVHFELTELSDPDSDDIKEDRNTQFTSAEDSKAEALVQTADSLHEFNPQMAKEHIKRFMNLISENESEFLKFDHIQNIIYGFVLAIRLGVINEDSANQKLSDLKFRFYSTDHIRIENGVPTQGSIRGDNKGANRGIEIIPNFELKEGYLVTIYNQDGNHPVWGNNIQMAPKQMKIIHKTENHIVLRGFGTDDFGNTFSDYGMTLELINGKIIQCILHMYDRDIDIEYKN